MLESSWLPVKALCVEVSQIKLTTAGNWDHENKFSFLRWNSEPHKGAGSLCYIPKTGLKA